MRKISQIAKRRHGLVAVTIGLAVALTVSGVCTVLGGRFVLVILAVLALTLACDVAWLGAEWVDEWRYQGLVDAWEAERHGMPVVEWPVPHDMEERVDMPMFGDASDGVVLFERDDGSEAIGDVDVSDTQTGQGIG